MLRRHLGLGRTAVALAGLGRRQLLADPFSGLPAPAGTGEWLTRRQLGPVILLEDTLVEDLGMTTPEACLVLEDIVGTVGALLLGRRFPPLHPDAWAASEPTARERLARRVFARLGNVAAADISTSDTGLSLDVRSCRFVSLLHRLGRPHLGTLFCKADSVFFDGTDAPVSLTRTTTLARGGPQCDFRFRLREV